MGKRKVIKHPDEKNSGKNKSKRRKVSIKTVSCHVGKEEFKCNLCNANFDQKSNLNTHISTVHEEKKQFKCDICNAEFTSKWWMNVHIVTIHEEKKKFKSRHGMKGHTASIHEGKKINRT